MRTSNYRKRLPTDNKIWRILWGSLAAVLLAGIIFFFAYYRVEDVEVMGSSHYSKDEVKEMILRGPLASNSVLAPVLYTKEQAGDVPFVEGFSVTQINRSTICISVKEKQPVGCIPYLDSYVYFDRSGVFIESSRDRDETVPYFDGIQVDHVIMDEKLPIKGTTVLNTAVALATIFQKNQMIPDHIQFDQNYQISLVYGDITVMLGKDKYLEDKMSRVLAILPQIRGQKGILHMENVTDSVKTITFEQEAIEITAENWSGGYDENGEYTGDGEYDEDGKHVGPKPMTELDYALAGWVGGYDEEGDYTGAGEYDAGGNHVGPPPTKESLEANGDWKGGYEEDGSYTGTGIYDREGNEAGPNPDAGQSTDSRNGEEGDENSQDGEEGNEDFQDWEEDSEDSQNWEEDTEAGQEEGALDDSWENSEESDTENWEDDGGESYENQDEGENSDEYDEY